MTLVFQPTPFEPSVRPFCAREPLHLARRLCRSSLPLIALRHLRLHMDKPPFMRLIGCLNPPLASCLLVPRMGNLPNRFGSHRMLAACSLESLTPWRTLQPRMARSYRSTGVGSTARVLEYRASFRTPGVMAHGPFPLVKPTANFVNAPKEVRQDTPCTIRIVQYNCFSLRGHGSAELVAKGAVRHRLGLLCLLAEIWVLDVRV